GWSLHYDTNISKLAGQTNVLLPVTGPSSPGPASAYPMTFDLTDVPEDVRVVRVEVGLTLSHTWPDDIRIGLESPAGTTVALMANAGGSNAINAVVLTFIDSGPPLPDAAQITSGTYRPTTYGSPTLGAPAPGGPYAT